VSAGQIAALIAAGAFVVLVGLLAVPLIKLGRTLDEATSAIRKASDESDPLFTGANTTVTHVNAQLERLDGITANAQAVTSNVSALTSLFTATLGGPLVRVAALAYGVSKAMRHRRKSRKSDERRKGDDGAARPRGRRSGGRR
jgi:predicted PurR-regulated permease PerM